MFGDLEDLSLGQIYFQACYVAVAHDTDGRQALTMHAC